MNQFSTILLKNSLLSSFLKYRRVFNSLFDPYDIGTNNALELQHRQITIHKDIIKVIIPYDENPDFVSRKCD